ncbi:hypothetical protein PIB30_076698 [Stylosanthes scabra]|uniref:Uncharacterized protein n=1 Tax=Stylosanthes scabra TaxID=79078 RepID=A0ABU6ZPL2_9FABA|nr:hypothetical protein [Stylosanthes scabra]
MRLRLETGFYPSVPTKGDGFLTPLRSLSRNSNGTTSSRPFWLDDEGKPFPWVYWNMEVRECRITTLDPLETPAFQFLQSLPVGLGKRLNFKCHWILNRSDAEVGAFFDSLLKDVEKKSRFDRLMQKMAEVEGMDPRSVLPHIRSPGATSGSLASNPVAPVSTLAASVPPVPPFGAVKARKKPSVALSGKPFSVEGEEGVTKDPSADLRQKKRKRKVSEASAEEAVLGVDSVGVENAFAAKVQMEKELAATRDQVNVLTAERNSALAAPLLNAKIKSLSQELELAEGEHLSAIDRMKEVEERAKVHVAELESCHSALEQERKKVESFTQSLKGKQTALGEAEAAAVHWRNEWKSLAKETREMVQETFEILMDQVCHLNPAIDYSMITLDTRWDPKAKRIYNPKAESQERSEPVVEDQPEPVVEFQLGAGGQPESPEEQVEGAAAGDGGDRNAPLNFDLAAFNGFELIGTFSECFDHPVGAFPVCS